MAVADLEVGDTADWDFSATVKTSFQINLRRVRTLVFIRNFGYGQLVNSVSCRGRLGWVLVLSLFSLTVVGARDRAIHLRNETIITGDTSNAKAAALPGDEKPASGLFLIQFDGPLQSAWRDQLQALGVDLLSYIPQDAFIVRLNSTPPGRIRQFDFVRWVCKMLEDLERCG